jgi:hypothetical protein
MFRAYGEKLVGPLPRFPAEMEQRINEFLNDDVTDATAITEVIGAPERQ